MNPKNMIDYKDCTPEELVEELFSIQYNYSQLLSQLDTQRRQHANEVLDLKKELTRQYSEKENSETELLIANRNLWLQNDIILSREAELRVVNQELSTIKVGKQKLAEELLYANQVLERREAELVRVYQELKKQNEVIVLKE